MVKNYCTLTQIMYPVGTRIDAARAHYSTSINAIKKAGLVSSDNKSDPPIIWIDGILSIEEAEKLKKYQRVNKIPCMDYICYKSTLFEELNNLRKKFPSIMNFYPPTYLLPNEYPELQRQHTFICGRKSAAPTWVIKPKNGSCGRGIYFVNSSYEASNITRPSVAQLMVNPYLLDGYKFDFRLFLLISSLEPFSAFIYKEGIARFCTEPYSPPTKANKDHYFMNLTNTAINIGSSKSPEQFTKPASEVIDKIIRMNPNAKNLWKSIIDLSRMLLASIYPTIIATLPNKRGRRIIKRIRNDPDIGEDGNIRLCTSARRPRTSLSVQRSQNQSNSRFNLTTSQTPRQSNSRLTKNSTSTLKSVNNLQNPANNPKNLIEKDSNSPDHSAAVTTTELNTDNTSTDHIANASGTITNTASINSQAITENSTINFSLQNSIIETETIDTNNSIENTLNVDEVVLSPSQHYFQILGIDIILDEDAQPKLLELNDRPSLSVTVPFENDLKINLMREMFYHVTADAKSLGDNKDSGWQQILPVENRILDIYNDVRKVMNSSSNIKYTGRIAANSPITNRMFSSGINKNLHNERRQRAVDLRESSRGKRFNNYLKASPY